MRSCDQQSGRSWPLGIEHSSMSDSIDERLGSENSVLAITHHEAQRTTSELGHIDEVAKQLTAQSKRRAGPATRDTQDHRRARQQRAESVPSDSVKRRLCVPSIAILYPDGVLWALKFVYDWDCSQDTPALAIRPDGPDRAKRRICIELNEAARYPVGPAAGEEESRSEDNCGCASSRVCEHLPNEEVKVPTGVRVYSNRHCDLP